MNHPRIDDDKIIDRYLAGRLPAEDEEAFELHLFECADCLEQVQIGEELRRGLQAVATEDVARAAVSVGWWVWFRSLRPAQLAAIAGLAIAFVWMPIAMVQQRAELSRLRSTPTNPGLVEPTGNFSVVSIGVQRSTEPVTIRAAPSDSAWLLSLELPPNPAEQYRVTLKSAAGDVLWRGEALEPSLYDTLLIALPTTYLTSGLYRLEVEASSNASEQPASIELRVLPSH